MALCSTALSVRRLSSPTRPPHFPKFPYLSPVPSALFRHRQRPAQILAMAPVRRRSGTASHASASQQVEEGTVPVGEEVAEWGKVSAVLFDMDGVLCNSEELSRMAAVDVFADMGVSVTTDDFIPFMGTGTLLPFSSRSFRAANLLNRVPDCTCKWRGIELKDLGIDFFIHIFQVWVLLVSLRKCMQRGWRLSVSSNNVDCLKIIPCYDDRCINQMV